MRDKRETASLAQRQYDPLGLAAAHGGCDDEQSRTIRGPPR